MTENSVKKEAEAIIQKRLTKHIVETQGCYQNLVNDVASALEKYKNTVSELKENWREAEGQRRALEAKIEDYGEALKTKNNKIEKIERSRNGFKANFQEAWEGLNKIRETLETLAPVGSVKNGEYTKPDFISECDVLVESIICLESQLEKERKNSEDLATALRGLYDECSYVSLFSAIAWALSDQEDEDKGIDIDKVGRDEDSKKLKKIMQGAKKALEAHTLKKSKETKNDSDKR